ncbi:MAG: hypothetical protein EP348_05310 [Alphaproteobacteria bacterium]|nr:MAG: hypothetical protein EP348_05310 [Alphaproteobacteria bacterium]
MLAFGFLLLMLSGCSHIDDNLLNQEIGDFSHSTVALAAVIQNDFGLAEKINSLAFVNNLELQLEAGGNPDTTLKPLFSGKDIAARQALLAALTGYAETMAVVASGKAVKENLPDISSLVSNLKSLKSEQFNLSHSLTVQESDDLVNDMSLFEELFILPARDARLVPIVEKGEAALKKAAMLLYLDIGAPEDQASQCNYSAPSNSTELSLSGLKLCRGGLRAIAATAIHFDVTTWKDRLQFERAQKNSMLATKRESVQRLVGIQRVGNDLDQLYADSQAALTVMLAAHGEIAATLNSAINSSLSKSFVLSKNALFLQKVGALVQSSNKVTQEVEALASPAAAAPSSQSLSDSFLTTGDDDVSK